MQPLSDYDPQTVSGTYVDFKWTCFHLFNFPDYITNEFAVYCNNAFSDECNYNDVCRRIYS